MHQDAVHERQLSEKGYEITYSVKWSNQSIHGIIFNFCNCTSSDDHLNSTLFLGIGGTSIIWRKNNERVFVNSKWLQLLQNTSHARVQLNYCITISVEVQEIIFTSNSDRVSLTNFQSLSWNPYHLTQVLHCWAGNGEPGYKTTTYSNFSIQNSGGRMDLHILASGFPSSQV